VLPPDYAPLLADIEARVRSARIKAGLAANRELLALYWDIGRLILDRQRREGWGAKVIDRLTLDLQRAFPGQQGFSQTNLLFMRAFADAWSEAPIVLRPVRQLSAEKLSQPATEPPTATAGIVQQPVGLFSASPEPMASLPWGHNLLLLHKLEKRADRIWYAAPAVCFTPRRGSAWPARRDPQGLWCRR
jgi:predicted nuclease of restriction endonuclease-like (RecB) superfamily